MRSGARYNGILYHISLPLIFPPDCMFIGPESDHCLPLSIKFLKLKFGGESEATLLKLLKSNYFGERTQTPIGRFGLWQCLNIAKGPSVEIS